MGRLLLHLCASGLLLWTFAAASVCEARCAPGVRGAVVSTDSSERAAPAHPPGCGGAGPMGSSQGAPPAVPQPGEAPQACGCGPTPAASTHFDAAKGHADAALQCVVPPAAWPASAGPAQRRNALPEAVPLRGALARRNSPLLL